jgi:4-hydroxybenzoate polyprenyltransferase
VITAAADAAAASALFYCTPGKTAAVTAAAALVYAGGVVLNDAADADRDRTLHPDRPIPRGTVSRRGAFLFAAALLAAGIGTAALAGVPSLAAFAGVTAVAAAYDLLLKRWGLAGAVAVGLCRGGSVLGAALSSPSFADLLAGAPSRALLVPLPWLLHGTAVTAASLLEESPRARALAPAAAAGVLLPAALAFPLLAVPGSPATGIAVASACLLALSLGLAVARVRAAAAPAPAGAIVREGVFGFLLLDAVVLGVRGAPLPAGVALGLWAVLRLALAGKRS